MAKPTEEEIGTFGLKLYAELAPLTYADEDLDWPLLKYVGGIGQMLQDLDELAHGKVPWSKLLDINLIPPEGLGWLAQFIGVRLDPNLSINQQKQQIRDHLAWQRGTVQSLKRAIQPRLSGTRTVDIVERDTDAYHFTIVTYGDETPPDITYADLFNAYAHYSDFFGAWASYSDYWLSGGRNFINFLIGENKPGGLQYTYTVTPGSPGTTISYLIVLINHLTYEEIYHELQTYQDLYERA